MDLSDIARERLANHGLAGAVWPNPATAVARMGALQAQDYSASLWAAGIRSGATQARVEAAITSGDIVRTWPMRGTLHMLAAADVRWMLDLMAARSIARARGRARQLEVDDQVLGRAAEHIERALAGGKRLTRRELYRLLDEAGIRPDGQRGIHILWQLSHRGLLCVGPRRGKDPTFVLFDDWVPPSPPLDRDEALIQLAVRYFSSHGPATERDLAWWSGLTLSDVRRAIDLAATRLESITVDDNVYWRGRETAVHSVRRDGVIFLPGFDEFVLGYTDRSVVLPPSTPTASCREEMASFGLRSSSTPRWPAPGGSPPSGIGSSSPSNRSSVSRDAPAPHSSRALPRMRASSTTMAPSS